MSELTDALRRIAEKRPDLVDHHTYGQRVDYFDLGRYDYCLREFRDGSETEPTNRRGHLLLWALDVAKGEGLSLTVESDPHPDGTTIYFLVLGSGGGASDCPATAAVCALADALTNTDDHE